MRVVEVHPAVDGETARVLLGIQHAAYAVEAALIGDDRIPALHEDVEQLRAADLRWRVAFLDGRIAGAVAWGEDADGLDIDRLIVAPQLHRRGVGAALVGAVQREAGTRRVVVSTGRANAPARRLYERLGFEHVDDAQAVPGLWVSRYRWVVGAPS